MAYTNVTDFISGSRLVAKQVSDALAAAKKQHDEFVRIGGQARLSPFFFEPDGTTPRTDLPYSFADLVAAMSAFEVLSGKVDGGGITGMAGQIVAQQATLDKIKG